MKHFLLLAFALLSLLTVGTVVFLFKAAFNKDTKHYFYITALGLDRLGAVVLYNKLGWTVSSLTYFRYIQREKKQNKKAAYYYFMKFIDFLFCDKEHCKNSYTWELSHRKNNTSKTTLKGLI